eukprot:TRINITY_DN3438_c0_g1_i1.p1 TRINITY_DN3438_c0_g1~~TRINITY_DN3438_c0_g1_i1.p1  ORF type:complete len:847 (-),score=310.33 TRINITY_DN3438_c0_g1_i1:81-2621(-)
MNSRKNLLTSSSVLRKSLANSAGELIEDFYDELAGDEVDLIDRELAKEGKLEDFDDLDDFDDDLDDDALMRVLFESKKEFVQIPEEDFVNLKVEESDQPLSPSDSKSEEKIESESKGEEKGEEEDEEEGLTKPFSIKIADGDDSESLPKEVTVWPSIQLHSLLLYVSKVLDKGILPIDSHKLSLYSAKLGKKIENISQLSEEKGGSFYLTEFEGVPWAVDPNKEKREKPVSNRLTESQIKRNNQKFGQTFIQPDESLRSPVCCVLGHVDAGKTSILDKVRATDVQGGEAGGITQQIGATLVPVSVIAEKTVAINRKHNFGLKIPGILVIDTPGHESFSNLRTRGSTLCDLAVIVIDILAGLEQQTIESIKLLTSKRCPFVIALNKIDKIYGWQSIPNAPFQDTLAFQTPEVVARFEKRMDIVISELSMQSINATPYFQNKDFRKSPAIVPTSARTGEGIPDLMLLIPLLSQKFLEKRIKKVNELQCTVLEVQKGEGVGTILDILLLNGELNVGDDIVLCSLNGAVVTNIRSIYSPRALEDSKAKTSLNSEGRMKKATEAGGYKLVVKNAEKVLAGTKFLVADKKSDLKALKEEVMKDFDETTSFVTRGTSGVHVQASTLGSLEALLEFLKVSEVPVASIGIGKVTKLDVMKASSNKSYMCILAFDVKVSSAVRKQSIDSGVTIIAADVIYHLCDQFKEYIADKRIQRVSGATPAFIAHIMEEYVMKTANPVIIGVALEGRIKVGVTLIAPKRNNLVIGTVGAIRGLEDPLPLEWGDGVCLIRIDPPKGNRAIVFGRDFTANDPLYPKLDTITDLVNENRLTKSMTKDQRNWTIRFYKTYGFKTPNE